MEPPTIKTNESPESAYFRERPLFFEWNGRGGEGILGLMTNSDKILLHKKKSALLFSCFFQILLVNQCKDSNEE